MYLDPASSHSSPAGDIGDADTDELLKQQLWQQVRSSFPGLPGSSFRLEQGGGDHLLLILDEKRAFRFPRSGKHGLDLERKVLRFLGSRALIAIPDYDLVDPEGRFASYLLVPGVSLTPTRFFALPTDTAHAAIADAVTLLTLLHDLDPRKLEPCEAWPRMWLSHQFADRLRKDRLPLLVKRMPTLAVAIASFLRVYQRDRSFREVVLHGDLVGDHLIVDEHTGRLTGVIDFSDIALGDPAHDFLGFWEYGASAAAHAVTVYGRVDADPTLLVRSRNHFIRYRIDRLFEMIADGAGSNTIQVHSAALAALLAEPFDSGSHA